MDGEKLVLQPSGLRVDSTTSLWGQWQNKDTRATGCQGEKQGEIAEWEVEYGSRGCRESWKENMKRENKDRGVEEELCGWQHLFAH